ncbi:hypothetical protein ACPPVO_35785 [Dactylosporangium sp. McL0621]|uniref:hypothetical protein n=1 Tax=Dactylosporangium sp. McL0621 TaxID=3415678 RepID=UPI003CED6E5B
MARENLHWFGGGRTCCAVARRRAWACWAWRKAVLAGSFLSGHYDALRVHLTTAMVMEAVAVVQAFGVVVLRRAGGPRSVMLLGLTFPVILAGLTGLGMTRVVALHVPLAVLAVVGLLRLAAWVWRTPLPGRAPAAAAVPSDRPVGALS